VRLAAAEALTKIGETQKVAGALAAAFSGPDEHLRNRARGIMTPSGTDARPFIAGLVTEMRDKDERRRMDAFDTLKIIASPEVVRSALGLASEADDPEVRRWAKASLERLDAKQ
jgi:HEAT repeat protein